MLDESGSVKRDNYELMTAFAKTFIQDLDAAVSLLLCCGMLL